MRDLRGLSPDLRRRLAPHIDGLAVNPRPPGVEKLEGSDSGFRIRVGDYRILYEINDAEQTVRVTNVGHRRDVYRAR